MKKIKISIIAVIAIVMGIVGSAFNSPNNQNHLDDGWFVIINPSDPSSAESYEFVGPTAPCHSPQQILCAIKGTRDGSNPDQPMQSDVDNAKILSGNFTMPVANLVAFKKL